MSTTKEKQKNERESKPRVPENFLKGKKGIILGLANKWSIAWGISSSLRQAGADFILTYQERVRDRVTKLAEELGIEAKSRTIECDVTKEEQIDKLFEKASDLFDQKIDFVIHSLAFAKREDLENRFIKTPKENYLLAQEISSYSLLGIAKRAEPLLKNNGGGSIVTMTYLGGERVVQNYNMMGVCKAALDSCMKYLAYDLGPSNIRINSISAGPIKTLASSAISGVGELLKKSKDLTPLKVNTDIFEVGDTASFLVSDLSRNLTGNIIYVDGGFNIVAATK